MLVMNLPLENLLLVQKLAAGDSDARGSAPITLEKTLLLTLLLEKEGLLILFYKRKG